MKILVTGGAGFIGSNFIIYMMNKYPNYEIVNLDKLTYAGNLKNLKNVADKPNYTFIKGDICDRETVKKAMEKCDTVVHFAAESHVDRSINSPEDFVKTNVLGTEILLETAKDLKIRRFHHISTDEVFGTLSLDNLKEKFNEQSPYNPRSPYSASKAGADHLVRAFIETYNFPATISNCSNNYGPYQDTEKFIPRMITNVINGGKIPIYGDGKYVRDWLFVEDHVRAIEMILKKGKVGETYLIGGQKKDLNNLTIAKEVLKIFGKDEESYIEFVKDRAGHDRRYAVDWSKINKELGWEPKYDFKIWLQKTVDWYIKNEWWWKEMKEVSEKFYASKNK